MVQLSQQAGAHFFFCRTGILPLAVPLLLWRPATSAAWRRLSFGLGLLLGNGCRLLALSVDWSVLGFGRRGRLSSTEPELARLAPAPLARRLRFLLSFLAGAAFGVQVFLLYAAQGEDSRVFRHLCGSTSGSTDRRTSWLPPQVILRAIEHFFSFRQAVAAYCLAPPPLAIATALRASSKSKGTLGSD